MKVCANPKSPAYHIELSKVHGMDNTVQATTRLSPVGLMGIQSISGLMMSMVDMNVIDNIRNSGYKKTYAMAMSKTYTAALYNHPSLRLYPNRFRFRRDAQRLVFSTFELHLSHEGFELLVASDAFAHLVDVFFLQTFDVDGGVVF